MRSFPMMQVGEDELREKEVKYCSHGDTVHYSPVPKFFQGCEGSFLYDREDKPYLDLQMWYKLYHGWISRQGSTDGKLLILVGRVGVEPTAR